MGTATTITLHTIHPMDMETIMVIPPMTPLDIIIHIVTTTHTVSKSANKHIPIVHT